MENLKRRVVAIMCVSCSSSLLVWLSFRTQRQSISNEEPTVKVLLFSYYRSGSSFLGSLFDKNPSAFYWFEPLALPTLKWGWVHDQIPPRNFYHYDNGTEKQISVDDLRRTLLSPIHKIFDCNLAALPDAFFTSKLYAFEWRSKMTTLGNYRRCLWRLKKTREEYEDKDLSRRCLPELTERCRRSNIVAVKTIRLRMKSVNELIETDPDVRLVYMIRDPRAMLNSWWRHTPIAKKERRYGVTEMAADARIMCLRILSDWRAFVELERKYPNNCLWFRYEDLSEHPDATAGRVYGFLGYQRIPGLVVEELEKMTKANTSDGDFGVLRENSSITASQWMYSMPAKLQKMVTVNCLDLLVELSYTLLDGRKTI